MLWGVLVEHERLSIWERTNLSFKVKVNVKVKVKVKVKVNVKEST